MIDQIFVWIGAIASIIGLVTSYLFFVDRKLSKNKSLYLLIRSYTKENRAKLCEKILNDYSYKHYSSSHHLIAKKNWFPETPIKVEERLITFGESSNDTLLKIQKFSQFPTNESGIKCKRMSEAVEKLENPKKFENRQHYRLLNYENTSHPIFMYSNQKASYFDKIDYGSLLEFEYARKHYLKQHQKFSFARLRFRNKLKNAENIMDKVKVLTGISTLTLLQDGDELRFIMHQRNNVGYAQGVFHVAPAGEFQPETDTPERFSLDFSFWKNIMREYAEEIGTIEELDGNSGFKTDYSKPPFSLMQKAIDENKAQLFYLGFGLDPLSLQGEVLTVCVFQHDTFKHIFPNIVDKNSEGTLYTEKEKWGVPFTKDVVDSYINNNTLQAGKAILELVWKYRDQIRIS
ncbi:hypothetical protein AAON49_11355 [Pseudotenacibaculum sp. MALMAid0570]|uniref:hypothetical protein n=1 Tax=Pseudotenacibaculum sp. MALMAid0570 TaxID=3143938 RepID=UPI0032DF580F